MSGNLGGGVVEERYRRWFDVMAETVRERADVVERLRQAEKKLKEAILEYMVTYQEYIVVKDKIDALIGALIDSRDGNVDEVVEIYKEKKWRRVEEERKELEEVLEKYSMTIVDYLVEMVSDIQRKQWRILRSNEERGERVY